jgi:hypothetical protein
MESLLYRPDLGNGIGYDGNLEVLLQGLRCVKGSPAAAAAGYPNSLDVLVFKKLLLRKGINLLGGKSIDPGPGSDPLYA